MTSVDDEWSRFMSSQSSINTGLGYTSISSHTNQNTVKIKKALKIKTTPENDINSNNSSCFDEPAIAVSDVVPSGLPICEDLYISTKTKVLFLNQPVDIHGVFWKIPINEYWRPMDGVVKKQMKIVSKTPEEYEEYRQKLEDVPYYVENIIKQINNPAARRIKFKDERKITVGISKKDIMNCRG